MMTSRLDKIQKYILTHQKKADWVWCDFCVWGSSWRCNLWKLIITKWYILQPRLIKMCNDTKYPTEHTCNFF